MFLVQRVQSRSDGDAFIASGDRAPDEGRLCARRGWEPLDRLSQSHPGRVAADQWVEASRSAKSCMQQKLPIPFRAQNRRVNHFNADAA